MQKAYLRKANILSFLDKNTRSRKELPQYTKKKANMLNDTQHPKQHKTHHTHQHIIYNNKDWMLS